MKIKINKVGNWIEPVGRNSKNFYKEMNLISYKKGSFNIPLTVRFYKTPTFRYCCLWGEYKGIEFSGNGGSRKSDTEAMIRALDKSGFHVEFGKEEYKVNYEVIHKMSSVLNAKNFTITEAHS